VGSLSPKRLEGGDGDGDDLTPFDLLLARMEDAITDAVLAGSTHDTVLGILVDLAIRSDQESRPLFPDLLHEPILYGHFHRMVNSALDILRQTASGE